MPLPLIPLVLGGIAVATGAKGVKDGVDAKNNIKEAKNINEKAQSIAKESEDFIKMAQTKTRESLEQLGYEKIRILSTSINDFVTNYEKIKSINLKEGKGISELKNFSPQNETFKELRKSSFEAKNIAVNGLSAIGGGALLAYGTYSTVMSGLGGAIVTATTGTAIGSLSGAAAVNATLAWLGGGALSAGGLGMAGGMTVLGGLVCGPALAVGGAMFASQSRTALNDSYSNYDKAKAFKQQAKAIGTALKGIFNRSNQLKDVLVALDKYLVKYNRKMAEIINRSGSNWSQYNRSQQEDIYMCVQVALTIKSILDTPLLDKNGELESKSAETLNTAQKYLQSLNGI